MTAARWRPMTAADLPAVGALADAIHVAHPESPAVFAERLALFPDGCLVAATSGPIVGYAIAHPGTVGAPPPLDGLLGRLPRLPDCLYVHDVAVDAAASGQGLGRSAFAALLAVARRHRLATLALIAVNDAEAFWARLGFRAVDDPSLAPKLASYGGRARYMLLAVDRRNSPDGL